METIINAMREYIGTPDFYIENGNYSGSWDYGAMLEYFFACLLVLVTVASVFKFIQNLVK